MLDLDIELVTISLYLSWLKVIFITQEDGCPTNEAIVKLAATTYKLVDLASPF